MRSLEDLDALHRAGRAQECAAAVREMLAGPAAGERVAAALFAVLHLFYSEFGPALAVLKPAFTAFKSDFDACAAISFAAWVGKDEEFAAEVSWHCIALDSKNVMGYLRLGLLRIGQERFGEAFCALSAGAFHSPAQAHALQPWITLAAYRMKGSAPVRIVVDGQEFFFEVVVFSGHAIEASGAFLAGTICEVEELRYVRAFVGRCETMVEVGASVGTHSVFCGKMLGPRAIYVFDASADAVRQTGRNLALNGLDQSVRTVLRHAAVGSRRGRLMMFGHEVDVVRLDDEVQERVDFMKIDVDGMELEVLQGCQGLIDRDRPKIMIEVNDDVRNDCMSFFRDHGYSVVHRIAGQGYANYFLGPTPSADPITGGGSPG